MGGIATELLSVPDAARQRRSIRAFAPGPLLREELEPVLDVVRLAPSAFNVQPWRFVVVESPEMKARLAAVAGGQRQVHGAPTVIVLYTDMADVLSTVDEVVHPGMDEAARAKARATILGAFANQSDAAREDWGAGQGYIALGYLLLAAEAHGLQTSPMLGFDPDGVKAVLGLPAHVRIPALVAIGHGVEEGFPHHRQPLERLVRHA